MNSDPTSGARLAKGIEALELAEFEDAIVLFEQAVVADASDPNAWFYLGLCYLETGRADLAIEALSRAIAADPSYADAHYLLGTAHGAAGQIDLAAESYRRALAIQPDHPKADEFLIRTEALIASREHYRSALRLVYSPTSGRQEMNEGIRELLQSVAIFNASPAAGEFQRLAGQIMEANEAAIASTGGEGPFWGSAVERAERAFDRKAWHEAASGYHE